MTRRFPSGAQNVIGRHLHPSAWQYDEWSSSVADALQAARVAAQDLMKNNPDRAWKIIAEWRAKSLEEKAATIRKQT